MNRALYFILLVSASLQVCPVGEAQLKPCCAERVANYRIQSEERKRKSPDLRQDVITEEL